MNNIELQALRRLLFFSVAEAARWVAATPQKSKGANPRTWQRWEAGTEDIPGYVVAKLREMCIWRQNALAAALRSMQGSDDVAAAVYASAEEWLSLEGRLFDYWRPHCSVVAELAAYGARLVVFDLVRYKKWLGKKQDSETARAEWAAGLSQK
jgi:Domain of unknown function (DUF1870)